MLHANPPPLMAGQHPSIFIFIIFKFFSHSEHKHTYFLQITLICVFCGCICVTTTIVLLIATLWDRTVTPYAKWVGFVAGIRVADTHFSCFDAFSFSNILLPGSSHLPNRILPRCHWRGSIPASQFLPGKKVLARIFELILIFLNRWESPIFSS